MKDTTVFVGLDVHKDSRDVGDLGTRVVAHIIVNLLQVKLNRLPDIGKGFFLRISFAYASWQARHIGGIPTFFTWFKHDS